MDFTARRSAQIVAIMLFSVVVTQIIYFALSSAGAEINRMIIWTTEAVAFLVIASFALVPLVRTSTHSAVWAAIAVGGTLNVIQVGMGLAMFGPVKDAGEAMAPAFQSILAGAFFLYFAGKFVFGFAAVMVGAGMLMVKGGAARGGAGKAIGAMAIVTGLAALFTNLGAMAVGMDMVLPAGAAGTSATLFLAIGIAMRANSIEG